MREARRSLEGGCAVALGGAGIQNRQVVPERIVVVVAVDLHGIAVAPPDLALQVLNPGQRIDEGEAHHLIVQTLAQVMEATQTRVLANLSFPVKPAHAVVPEAVRGVVEAVGTAVEGEQERAVPSSVEQRPQIVCDAGGSAWTAT